MALLKSLFSFRFSGTELSPLQEFQSVVQQDTVLRGFSQQSLLEESLMRMLEGQRQASILARAAGEAAGRERAADYRYTSEKAGAAKAYVMMYYNPETRKAEILGASGPIRVPEGPVRSVEEALGAQSLYPLYSFIAAPLMRVGVLPWKLEQILSEREYGTPPPAAPGGGLVPVRRIAQTEAELAAERKTAGIIRVAASEAIVRKEQAEIASEEELLVLEEVIRALRGGEALEKALKKLPPLSRARYLIALRKKRLGVQVLMQLLLHDVVFLKTIKKKLATFSLEDLVGMVKLLQGMRKEK
jgi:hypothetical protein